MNRELLQQALDALCKSFPTGGRYEEELESAHRAAITALREELAKPDPEPVAWLSTDCIGERYLCFSKPLDNDPVEPLYLGVKNEITIT